MKTSWQISFFNGFDLSFLVSKWDFITPKTSLFRGSLLLFQGSPTSTPPHSAVHQF